jgi:hypothetical protein
MISVVTVVRQIMRELKGAASENAKIMAITNIVYNLLQGGDRFHKPLKVKHLMQMAFQSSTMRSVNSCKTYM